MQIYCNKRKRLNKKDSPKSEYPGLLILESNIVLHENEKFTKTDSQLPIDPDQQASLMTLRRS